MQRSLCSLRVIQRLRILQVSRESSLKDVCFHKGPLTSVTHIEHVHVAAIRGPFCLVHCIYYGKWKARHMSPLNACCSGCAREQVRPTDSQYRDYKRNGDSLWSELEPVKVDTAKLEQLFESKSKEMPVTKVNKLSSTSQQLGASSF